MDRIDILTRACELYLEGGAEAVSMRRLARDLGVTAPALYRHYDSREEMLLDVVAEAYRRLSERLYGALSGRTPAERLYLAGQAYLDFALDQPKYYEMLYTPAHTLGAEEFPEQVTEQVASVGRFFNDRVRECIDAGLFQPLDPADVSRTLWAHAHGLISIYLRGCLHMDAEEFRRHYRASSRRAITGMATPAYEAEMGRAIEDLSRTEAAVQSRRQGSPAHGCGDGAGLDPAFLGRRNRRRRNRAAGPGAAPEHRRSGGSRPRPQPRAGRGAAAADRGRGAGFRGQVGRCSRASTSRPATSATSRRRSSSCRR